MQASDIQRFRRQIERDHFGAGARQRLAHDAAAAADVDDAHTGQRLALGDEGQSLRVEFVQRPNGPSRSHQRAATLSKRASSWLSTLLMTLRLVHESPPAPAPPNARHC